MRRQLERLANERFDIHVIGGGATGAAIARDCHADVVAGVRACLAP